eukprot:1139293-Pelagomonas_calceolata.AAC.15
MKSACPCPCSINEFLGVISKVLQQCIFVSNTFRSKPKTGGPSPRLRLILLKSANNVLNTPS